MKVLYLTIPSFFDLEISLIRELSKKVDLKVIMFLNPSSMHSSAFSVEELDKRCDIIPISEYAGLEKYLSFVEISNWYIANNPDNSLISCLRLAWKVKKFYKEGGFTFLHNTSFAKEGLFMLPFVWKLRNKLMTKHDPIPHNEPNIIEKLRLNAYHKAYKNLLFLSDSLTTEFCKRYKYDLKNIYYSHLSVYDYLLGYKTTPIMDNRYILFFGRITEYKGVDILIDSYLKSEAFRQGIKLVIAGKGTISHNIKSLSDDVVFINKYIENEELSSLIAYSKFVVLPYKTATQSGCVMSAYAFKKPIIATRVGDLPNEVLDNLTGLTCDPNSVESLTEAINQMLSMNIDALCCNIQSKYFDDGPKSWENAAEAILEVYKKISKQ